MLRQLLWLLAFCLAGCASIPDDRGWLQIQTLTAERGQPLPDHAGSRCNEAASTLSSRPLELASAITLALLCNPRIDASYAQLGLAGADVLKAGRLSNPLLSASYGFSGATAAADRFGFGISADFLDLLLMPAKRRLAEDEFERARLQTGNAVLALAADVRHDWFDYVAARQSAGLHDAIADAADAAAQYAEGLLKAGNLNALELDLRQADAAQMQLQRIEAQETLAAARRTLQRSIGLPDDAAWETPATLPLPVASEDAIASLQMLAQQRRLDLAAAELRVSAAGQRLQMARGTRWLDTTRLGGSHERDTDGIASSGPTIDLGLPLLNQGQGRVMQAQADLEAARADQATLQLDVEEQIAQASAHLTSARARLDLLRSRLLPAREQVVAQTQKQFNYMLAGTFELLLARQQQYDAFQRYDDALRDYWLARAALAQAVGTALPSDARIGVAEFGIDTLLKSAAEGEAP